MNIARLRKFKNNPKFEKPRMYRFFIRYALSGLVIKDIEVDSKDDVYWYVGYLVLNSIEHICRIDYKEV